jgi:hypothetical protein
MNEKKFEEYLPWIVGGVLVIIGLYFYKNSSPTVGTNYVTVPPADTSATDQANAALAAASLQAKTQAFTAGLTLIDNNATRASNLQIQQEQDSSNLAIAQANNDNQLANQKVAASVANHQANTQAIGSIVGGISSIAALAIFCYDVTNDALLKRNIYNPTSASPVVPASGFRTLDRTPVPPRGGH